MTFDEWIRTQGVLPDGTIRFMRLAWQGSAIECAKICDTIADGVHEAEAGQCAAAIREII